MNGEITLCTLIEEDPAVLALVTSASHIQIGIVEPADWLISDTTVSIYNAVGTDNRNNALITDLTVNCRADTETKVKQLSTAVINAVNRVQTSEYEFYCFTGGIIPPQDENDSYNLPITVTVKAVKELI